MFNPTTEVQRAIAADTAVEDEFWEFRLERQKYFIDAVNARREAIRRELERAKLAKSEDTKAEPETEKPATSVFESIFRGLDWIKAAGEKLEKLDRDAARLVGVPVDPPEGVAEIPNPLDPELEEDLAIGYKKAPNLHTYHPIDWDEYLGPPVVPSEFPPYQNAPTSEWERFRRETQKLPEPDWLRPKKYPELDGVYFPPPANFDVGNSGNLMSAAPATSSAPALPSEAPAAPLAHGVYTASKDDSSQPSRPAYSIDGIETADHIGAAMLALRQPSLLDRFQAAFEDDPKKPWRDLDDAGAGRRANGIMASGLMRGVTGLAGGVMNSAISGFQAGGPFGALASVGSTLLTSSKQFQGIMDAVNPLLKALADLLGSALAPTADIIKSVAEPLGRLLQVVTPLVELFMMLNGPLLLVQIAAEQLGRIIRWVASGILNAILAFLKGIQRLAKKFDIHIGALDDAIDALKDMKNEMNGAADAANAAAAAFTNMPEGYKYALERFRAMDAEAGGLGGGASGFDGDVGGVNLGPKSDAIVDAVQDAMDAANDAANDAAGSATGQFATSGSGGGARTSGFTFTGPITVVANDPDEFLRKLERLTQSKNTRRGGSLTPVRKI